MLAHGDKMPSDAVVIHKWNQLTQGWSSLLLGNGASMAIDSCFGYGSLLEAAKASEGLSAGAAQIFDDYETTNFEFVLESLGHALRINSHLCVPVEAVAKVHGEVRDALIKAVKSTHCEPAAVQKHANALTPFLKQFATIVTFNYDLTLYWAILEANRESGPWFKDGFIRGKDSPAEKLIPFVSWWKALSAIHRRCPTNSRAAVR